MASLVLGAAGALVGSFFGPLGASIGWSVGAALGNALFPQGQTGPRLTDLKLQNSSYGAMIPILYGTVRISGLVMWETDLQEHAQHSGGKGGPEQTSFTYSASFAILLCEGPIGGVLRIWADSRLVWDPSSMDPSDFPFTLYLGTESQLPDPTMEGVEGVGNVPGHRGTAYAVFDTFYLTDYGNRIPSFTFEVFTAGSPIPWRYSTFTPFNLEARAGPGGGGPQSGAIEGGNLVMSYFTDHAPGDDLTDMPTQLLINSYDLDGNLVSNDLDVLVPAPSESNTINVLTLNCLNNPHITYARGAIGFTGAKIINAFYYDGVITAEPVLDISGTVSALAASHALMNMPIFFDDAVFGCGGQTSAWVSKWNAPGGSVLSGTPIAEYALPGAASGSTWTQVIDTITGDVWLAHQHSGVVAYDELIHLDSDLTLIESWAFANFPTGFTGNSGTFTVWNGYFVFTDSGNDVNAYIIEANSTFTLADPGTIPCTLGNTISLGTGLVLVADGIISLQPRSAAVTLGDIVSDLSVRAGLTTDQIDVTELGDLVDGYVIGNQSDVRSLIEPLQSPWPFDPVEHDVVVKFVRRGYEGIAATVSTDDMGAYVWPGEPVEVMETDRLQEVDLPRQVDAVFINKDTDYQNGEQRAQRLITTSQLVATLQLPIVMPNEKAKETCESRLYEAWIERERFKTTLPRKWITLEPSDVVHLGDRMVRIRQKNDGADGIIRVDALATSLQLYLQATPAPPGLGMPGSGGVPPTPPPVLQDTDLLLLDLPLVRDADNPVGFYAAMAGAVQVSWPGATLYKSIDGGSTFNSELVNTTHDTFGDCSTTLGTFGGGNVFDEINSLTVVLSAGSGTLSSVNRLAILNGANMAAVGTVGTTGIRQIEIIQFRDAELIGTLTYKLTGLRRGRRGSEWMIPLHVSGEKFVLLPTATNVNGASAELYLARKYRAVTAGRPLSSAAVVDFTNYGIAALPYGPCDLGGGRQTNDDILLTWKRRTRIGGTWMPFVDVPLSENVEAYQVRIYTDGTYATPIRVVGGVGVIDTTQYTYTAADQTTDFGSPRGRIYWGVSQLGTYSWGTETKGAT